LLIYFLICVVTTVIYLTALASLLRKSRELPLAWRLLAYSGIPLSLGGIGFIARFWRPTAGPYLANTVYPFGAHLNAWAVSFGFMWVTFGLLFTFACLQVAQAATRQGWFMLLGCWALAWLPHGVIGVAFAIAGSNRESIDIYRLWGSDPAGFVTLANGAFVMLSHFVLSIVGFVATGCQMIRSQVVSSAA